MRYWLAKAKMDGRTAYRRSDKLYRAFFIQNVFQQETYRSAHSFNTTKKITIETKKSRRELGTFLRAENDRFNSDWDKIKS